MHLVTPPPDWGCPLLFNIDASVGQQCPSAVEDVLLVQLLLRKAGAGCWFDTEPAVRAHLERVRMSGACDALTIDGIRAVQEPLRRLGGAAVDGRVCPYAGDSSCLLFFLNFVVRQDYHRTWPRLQDFPDCPTLLKARMRDRL
jgi:hypothetical protein